VAVSSEARAFVLELFGELGGVTARPMMGGVAVYADGRIFAIVGPEDRIFLKAAGPLAAAMAAEGSAQFVYDRAGRASRMGYWTLPDAALDDPAVACAWARRSLDAAARGFT
jgi:DNA transformation protein